MKVFVVLNALAICIDIGVFVWVCYAGRIYSMATLFATLSFVFSTIAIAAINAMENK